MAPTGDHASALGTKGKGSKPKTKSVHRLLELPPAPAATASTTAGSGSRRSSSQSVVSSETCESPATAASVARSFLEGLGSVAASVDAPTTTTTSPPTQVPINVDNNNDDQEDDEDPEQACLSGKRRKKCTSWVWKYFTKKKEYVEVQGK